MKRRLARWGRRLVGDSRSARFRKPMHRSLGPLLQLPQLLASRIGFVSCRARNRLRWIPFRAVREFIFTQGTHLGMALNAWRDRRCDFYLIFEHKAGCSLPLYLVLLVARKPVFFFVHDMQQAATTSVRRRLALDLCRWWVTRGEFYPLFISLNDGGLASNRRFDGDKGLTIPHPHPLAEDPPPPRPPRQPTQRYRVGIVGSARKERPIRRLVEVLRRARGQRDFDFVVGLPLAAKPAWLDTVGAEIMDTTTHAQYSECLASLDIFVVDFTQPDYFFRPSGAVVDAGMNGCFVLCPDFLVFREQITQPAQIGTTFRVLEEVPLVLGRIMEYLDEETIDFPAWREYRRAENIAAMMRAFLEQRAAVLAPAALPATAPSNTP